MFFSDNRIWVWPHLPVIEYIVDSVYTPSSTKSTPEETLKAAAILLRLCKVVFPTHVAEIGLHSLAAWWHVVGDLLLAFPGEVLHQIVPQA